MNGRDTVLSNIRRSLGVKEADPARTATVNARLDSAPANTIPERGQRPPDEQVALFCDQAEGASARIVRVAAADDLPEAIAEVLRKGNLPAKIRTGDDPRLADLPWERTQHIERTMGPSDGTDVVGLSYALGGVAETGTLALASGPENPTTLNFLPDAHLVVLDATDVRGDYESVWTLVRQRYGKGEMPRTVNLVTGPSRSADIEQTLLLGAHGPRSLHIFIVGGEASDAGGDDAATAPAG